MMISRPVAYLLFALPWVLVVCGLAWLVVLRFPPSGTFSVATNFNDKSAWIAPFLPAERVSPPGVQPEGWVGQRMVSDPVYFTARAPGPYDTVDVEVEFRSIHQPLIEFGMIRDTEGKSMEMNPLFASELEDDRWRVAKSGGRNGYVASDVPNERLADPDTRGLAVWNSSSSMPLMKDSVGADQITNVSLRGSHDLYLIPTDRVRVVFTLQPVNRSAGNDVVSFRAFRGEQEFFRETIGLSGSRDTRMGEAIDYVIDIPHADVGVFRVSVVMSDDVFIRRIATPSERWVVGPRLVFGDVSGYATSTMPGRAWTNSRHLVVETFHTEGLQRVLLGRAETVLQKTHVAMRIDRDDADTGPVPLVAPQGDIRVIGDGFFAFSKQAFFEPSPRRLTSNMSLSAEHIQAIVTPYVRPEHLTDGWMRSRASFTLDPKQEHLRFVVSAPGILERGGAVDVRRIRVTYYRRAVAFSDWLRTLRQEIANAWHRL